MANKKEIIVILLVTIGVIALLALWTGNKKGDVALLGEEGRELEELEIPLAPTEENINNSLENNDNALDVAAMDTQNVVLKTSKGDITLELFTGAMPITTGNFLKLAEEGFYDDTKFHRVIDGFMIQGGDANSKGDNVAIYGQGGPGYTIEDEFVEGDLLTNVRGTIAMANTGQPNSGGSQFFINLDNNTFLDFDKEPLASKHPVFGRVVAGMDVVDQIAKVETGLRDVPVEPVVVESVTAVEAAAE